MKIFCAGLATETNTFSSEPTTLEHFQVNRGSDARKNASAGLDLAAIWARQAKAAGASFVSSLMAWAEPSGITVRSAYETLRDEILTDLARACPVDIVLFNLHGAMIAEGYDDCELDLISRVREIIGPEAVVAVEFDLHCNLNPRKIAGANLVITYKEYPHTDVSERAQELFDLALLTRKGAVKPTMAFVDCHMVGLFPTMQDPLRSVIKDMRDSEQQDGVLSISFAHGFQFVDAEQLGAGILVITDNDPALARQLAIEYGRRIYEIRHRIGFDSISLPMDEALHRAATSRKRPVVVADQSDNTGGGAPGDSTFALEWILRHNVENVALAWMYDPEVVRAAKEAGVGAFISVQLGGKIGAASGSPLQMNVRVRSLHSDYYHAHEQSVGKPRLYPMGDIAALSSGTIDIIVSSKRCQCFSPTVFEDCGIDLATKAIIIPKSIQHFYNAFAPFAGEIIYMAGPGATPPDPRVNNYQRFDTNDRYPWHADPLQGGALISTATDVGLNFSL